VTPGVGNLPTPGVKTDISCASNLALQRRYKNMIYAKPIMQQVVIKRIICEINHFP